MRKLLWFACLILASSAGAQGRPDTIGKPIESQERAFTNLQVITTGAWINGDWGIKVLLSSGKGPSTISVPMDVIGGWAESSGRWQRLHLPTGGQWFIKGQPIPTVSKIEGTAPVPLTPAELASPIIDRIGLSWNLYTMSFLSWPDRTYISVERTHGRWCDKVELKGNDPTYASAWVWIDTEFGIPLEAELYDAQGNLLKTLRAVSMKKAGSDWMLKRWEVLDAVSHAKVTIDVTAVALGGRWPNVVFDEKSLAPGWPELAPEAWKALE